MSKANNIFARSRVRSLTESLKTRKDVKIDHQYGLELQDFEEVREWGELVKGNWCMCWGTPEQGRKYYDVYKDGKFYGAFDADNAYLSWVGKNGKILQCDVEDRTVKPEVVAKAAEEMAERFKETSAKEEEKRNPQGWYQYFCCNFDQVKQHLGWLEKYFGKKYHLPALEKESTAKHFFENDGGISIFSNKDGDIRVAHFDADGNYDLVRDGNDVPATLDDVKNPNLAW